MPILRTTKVIPLLSNPIPSIWLLYDDFLTNIAAGSVNGTQAEPIGGTRAVTDTNNVLSIAGGYLSIATGSFASTNPGIWYPSTVRVAGKPFITELIYDSAIGFQVGWNANTSGVLLYDIDSSSVNLRIRGAAQVTVGAIVGGVTYQLAIILRASGAFYYIKGGTFTNWTLIYVDVSSTTATLYPNLSANSTTNVWRANYVKIPIALWLPTPLLSDGFSILGGTDGLGHAEGIANGLGAGGSGLIWVPNTSYTPTAPTPTLGSEILTDGGLENWNSSTDLTSWIESLSGTSTINKETTVIDSGLAAARLDIDGSNSFAQLAQTTTATIGTWYLLTARMKNSTTGKSARIDFSGVNGFAQALTTSYASYYQGQRATSTTPSVLINRSTATSSSVYIDNISVKPLVLSSLLSASTTYAQTNYVATCTPTLAPGTQAGMALQIDNLSNPANGVFVYHDGTNVRLDKLVGGTWTNLINGVSTYVAGAQLIVRKNGNVYTVIYNGVQIGTDTTISDAGVIAGTFHNLFSTINTNTFGAFTITDYTTWINNGGKALNFPNIGSEILTDSGLENWNSATDLTSWTETIAGTSTVNREATLTHGGSFACRLDIDSSLSNAQISQTYTQAIGTWYRISTWMRGDVGAINGRITPSASNFSQGTVECVLTTAYQQFNCTGRGTTTTATSIIFNRSSAANSHSIYIDDVSIKPLALTELISGITLSAADVIADISLVIVTGTQAGLCLNLDSPTSPANFVLVYHDGANVKIDKCVGGTWSNVNTTTSTAIANAVLRVAKIGSAYRIYYNNALITNVTISDAGIINNVLHGRFNTYSGNTLDNMVIYASGSNGEYSVLDNYIQ